MFLLSNSNQRLLPFSDHRELQSAVFAREELLFSSLGLFLPLDRGGECPIFGLLIDFAISESPLVYYVASHLMSDDKGKIGDFLADFGPMIYSDEEFQSLISNLCIKSKKIEQAFRDSKMKSIDLYLNRIVQAPRHLLLLSEKYDQDLMNEVRPLSQKVSILRFARYIDDRSKTFFAFDSLYSFHHSERDELRTNLESIEFISKERSRSDTIVIALSEDRFHQEFLHSRLVQGVPILAGSKARLRFAAIVREGRHEAPLYISRIEDIQFDQDGHGHMISLSSDFVEMDKQIGHSDFCMPLYAKAVYRKDVS